MLLRTTCILPHSQHLDLWLRYIYPKDQTFPETVHCAGGEKYTPKRKRQAEGKHAGLRAVFCFSVYLWLCTIMQIMHSFGSCNSRLYLWFLRVTNVWGISVTASFHLKDIMVGSFTDASSVLQKSIQMITINHLNHVVPPEGVYSDCNYSFLDNRVLSCNA